MRGASPWAGMPPHVRFACSFEVDGRLNFDVRTFVNQMDAVIGMLDSTADAAATWDIHTEGSAE
jgi:hypothetical protein